MLQATYLESLDVEGVRVFASLTEAQLRTTGEGNGLFIAESPKVINVALDAGYEPVALLCEERHLKGDARVIVERIEQYVGRTGSKVQLYTGSRELLARLTGYTLTRGVLCAMRRPTLPSISTLLADAHRVVVIDGVVDSTNIGAIFRSAAALGIDAALITHTSCDPLNRRAVRVSMGSVFLLPWTWIDEPIASLHNFGFKTVAMALRDNSTALDDARLAAEPRLAIVMGTEGDGLADHVIASADYTVCIPMRHNVDSLNVAAASAVAFYQLCK